MTWRTRLLLEMAVIYGIPPLLFLFRWLPGWVMLPSINLAALAFAVLLWRDPGVPHAILWNAHRLRWGWPRMVVGLLLGGLGVACVMAMVLLLHRAGLWAAREGVEWFNLPRNEPRRWALLSLLYPLLSVYGQEILFRAWFFHRYGPLFHSQWQAVWINACVFGYAHLLFRNPVGVALTMVGGVLFARTWIRTKSMVAVSLEHALFGYWVFTIGLLPYLHM